MEWAGCIDRELAEELMRYYFRKGADLIDVLVGEMSSWDELPEKFAYDGPAWNKAETEIADAAAIGNWVRVVNLGQAYVDRIEAYVAQWRPRFERALKQYSFAAPASKGEEIEQCERELRSGPTEAGRSGEAVSDTPFRATGIEAEAGRPAREA